MKSLLLILIVSVIFGRVVPGAVGDAECRTGYGIMGRTFCIPTRTANAGMFSRSSAPSSCRGKSVPRGKCAVLYDDADCAGWQHVVPVGYSELSVMRRNDAESLIVRPGCKFVGYDHDNKKSVVKRGDSVTVNAWNDDLPKAKNLTGKKELEERISSVQCNCRTFSAEQCPSSVTVPRS